MFLGGADREGLAVFDTRCFERYVSALQDPGTVHAMCQDYRASASLDLDEAREDLENGRRIKCPLRVLWGKKGVIEKCFDALKEWRDVVDEGVPVDGASIDTGHYIPESAPDEVASNILEFFV